MQKLYERGRSCVPSLFCRLVLSSTPMADATELTVRPMTSFAWCFWQELIQLVNHELI